MNEIAHGRYTRQLLDHDAVHVPGDECNDVQSCIGSGHDEILALYLMRIEERRHIFTGHHGGHGLATGHHAEDDAQKTGPHDQLSPATKSFHKRFDDVGHEVVGFEKAVKDAAQENDEYDVDHLSKARRP